MTFEELQVESPVGREGFQERRVVIRAGEHTLICGAPGEGKTPLFRAISGLWPWGSGRIVRPRDESVMYVPRGTPYLPRGTLREVLAYPLMTDRFEDRDYVEALERTGLGRYARSLDAQQRWDRELREDEQMALALARVVLARSALGRVRRHVLRDGGRDARAGRRDVHARRHADDGHSHRPQHADAPAVVQARAASDEDSRASAAQKKNG